MLLLVFLINALMGATFSIIRFILSYTNPLFLVGFRMVLAGSILLGYLLIFRRTELKVNYGDWPYFFRVAIFHIYLAYVLEVWGLKYLPAAKVALLYNLTPLVSACLSVLIYNQRQTKLMITGLIIGFFGFLPILFEHSPLEEFFGQIFFITVPEIAILFAIFAGAYGWLLVKELIMRRSYSVLLVNGFGMLLGGALTFITAQFVWLINPASSMVQPWPFISFSPILIWVLVLILFSNIIFYNVYGHLLRHYSPTFLSFTGMTIPLFAACWEWLILGQVVSIAFWWSLLIVSSGLSVYYYADCKNL